MSERESFFDEHDFFEPDDDPFGFLNGGSPESIFSGDLQLSPPTSFAVEAEESYMFDFDSNALPDELFGEEKVVSVETTIPSITPAVLPTVPAVAATVTTGALTPQQVDADSQLGAQPEYVEASSSSAAASVSSPLAGEKFTTAIDFLLASSPALHSMPEVYAMTYPDLDTDLDGVNISDWKRIFETKYNDARDFDVAYVSPMRTQRFDKTKDKKVPTLKKNTVFERLAGDIKKRLLKAKAKDAGLVNRHAVCRYTDVDAKYNKRVKYRYRVRHCLAVEKIGDEAERIRENAQLNDVLDKNVIDKLQMLLDTVVDMKGSVDWVTRLRMNTVAYFDHVSPRYSLSVADSDYYLSRSERDSFPDSVASRFRVNVVQPVWTVDYIPYLQSDVRTDSVDTLCCTLRINMPVVYTAVEGEVPTRFDAIKASQWLHVVLFGGISDEGYIDKRVIGKENYNNTVSEMIGVSIRTTVRNYLKRSQTVFEGRRVVINVEIVPGDIPYLDEQRGTQWVNMPRATVCVAFMDFVKFDSSIETMPADDVFTHKRGQTFAQYVFGSDLLGVGSDRWKTMVVASGAKVQKKGIVDQTNVFLRYRAHQDTGLDVYKTKDSDALQMAPMQVIHEIYGVYNDVMHLVRAREYIEHEFFALRTGDGKYRVNPTSADEIRNGRWRSQRHGSIYKLYDWEPWYEDDVAATYSFLWGAAGTPLLTKKRPKKAAVVISPVFELVRDSNTRAVGPQDLRLVSSFYSDERPLYARMIDGGGVARGALSRGATTTSYDSLEELTNLFDRFDKMTSERRLVMAAMDRAHMTLTGITRELMATPFIDYVALDGLHISAAQPPYDINISRPGVVKSTDVEKVDAVRMNNYTMSVWATAEFAHYTVPSVLQWAHSPYAQIYALRLGGLYRVEYSEQDKQVTIASFDAKMEAVRSGNVEKHSNAAFAVWSVRSENEYTKANNRRFFFTAKGMKPINMAPEMLQEERNGVYRTNYVM